MLLSIVIPTFNGKLLLQDSIKAVVRSSIKFEYEIIVVDNNSSDNTKAFINKHYPDVVFCSLSHNKGFACAINTGVGKARGKYLLILNNDCIVERDAIATLIRFLDMNSSFVATQPIVYKKKERIIDNIGYIVDTWVGRARLVKLKSEILNLKSKSGSPDSKSDCRYIYGLSATCLLIRTDIFKKIGMFDEAFHSYLEDVDLFIRLSQSGHEYGPAVKAHCFHKHMATSSRMGSYKYRQDFKNWIRIIAKNFSPKFIILHFPTLFIERTRNLNGILKAIAS